MKTFFVFIGVLFIVVGCRERDPSMLSMKMSEGVVLHSCIGIGWKNNWIENTDDYAIRIRKVHHSWGEKTEFIHYMKPHSRITVSYLYQGDVFYVYKIDGVLVDWLTPP